MESTDNPLLLQLTPPQWDPELVQLRWHCPFSQEQVAGLVPALMARLDCQLGPQESGADRLFWPVRFEDATLSLHFEALCDCLWLQTEGSEEGKAELAFLARLAGAMQQGVRHD